jgi:hypothetical protein
MVTVPQGSTSTTFSVTAGSVSSLTSATVTASYSGVSKTFGVTVITPHDRRPGPIPIE